MPAPSRPLVALLTDFGTRDPYVAAMKGVIASRVDAEIVDLGHEIAPQDVLEAAVFLRFTIPSFAGPRLAVLVAVVDPGVGSSRRIVAASRGSLVLLAPDNGIPAFVTGPGWELRSVTNEELFLRGPSATFHGRDRFAPAAAAIAAGLPRARLGDAIDHPSLVRLPYDPPAVGVDEVRGCAIAIDRFGNVITDVEAAVLGDPSAWIARAGGREIARVARTYADLAGSPDPFLIVGSRGTLELSVSGGRAADVLQIARLDPVVFERRPAVP